MKKFVFSLEKVHNFKQQTLDVKKNELAGMNAQLMELENKIAELNRKFKESNQKMVTEMEMGITPKDIAIYKSYFNQINIQIKKLTVEKLQLMQIIEQKKQEIVSLNSEISGLERLKDKQLEFYNKTVQKAEELAIEEFVSHAR